MAESKIQDQAKASDAKLDKMLKTINEITSKQRYQKHVKSFKK